MMKRFLMILVLGLLLNSCETGGYNTSSTEPTMRHKCVVHGATGKEVCGFGFTYQAALKSAMSKCRVAYWKNNPDACGKESVAEKPTKPAATSDDGKIIIIGSGSGFFVTKQGHVVSNDHVIGICKKVIAYEEGKEINLDILATDMVNDIGLVKGKFQKVSYLNIKPDGAELGEDIVAFGYPLSRFTSDSVKLTKGIVSSLSGPGNNYSQIQIDAAIQPGSSGGPILNMNGQVIGVAVSGLSKKLLAQETDYIPENVNFAVAAQSLMSFLKGNKVSVGTGASRTLSTKELAKIGEPATIQLFCMNTREAYAKLKKADKHSDVLLDLQ